MALWCSVILVFNWRLLYPMYILSQSLHSIWYTEFVVSSIFLLSSTLQNLFFNVFVGLLLSWILNGLRILLTCSEVPFIYGVDRYLIDAFSLVLTWLLLWYILRLTFSTKYLEILLLIKILYISSCSLPLFSVQQKFYARWKKADATDRLWEMGLLLLYLR